MVLIAWLGLAGTVTHSSDESDDLSQQLPLVLVLFLFIIVLLMCRFRSTSCTSFHCSSSWRYSAVCYQPTNIWVASQTMPTDCQSSALISSRSLLLYMR